MVNLPRKIVISALAAIILSACSSQTTQNTTPEASPSPELEVTPLTHDDLRSSNADTLIGNIYQMYLYLDQMPTDLDAYFLSQPDSNSFDTALILCFMVSEDLIALDGESAQRGEMPAYDVLVEFSKANTEDGIYEANCELMH